MKNKTHLPRYGVGPLYISGIILLTAAGIWLAADVLPSGQVTGVSRLGLALLGAALAAEGIPLLYGALVSARVGDFIRSNTLLTTGVYAWVRNPIYSAFLLFCTGALLLAGNLWLLFLPPAYWAFLTVLMRCTEERWLLALYGTAYVGYCGRVNRCIPWFPQN